MKHETTTINAEKGGNKMKAVIYARYSLSNVAHNYIRKQIAACEKYAEAHGIEIVDTYSDVGLATAPRTGFNQLLADAAEDKFNLILVFTFDRFAVKVKDVKETCNVLLDKKIDIVSVYDGYTFNFEKFLASPTIKFAITDD